MKIKIDDKRIIIIRSDKNEIWTLDPRKKVYIASTFKEITDEVKRKIEAIDKKIEEYRKNSRLKPEAKASLIAYEQERKRRLDAKTYAGNLEDMNKKETFGENLECRLWKYTPSRDDSPIDEIVFYVAGSQDIGTAAKTFFASVQEIACYYKIFAPVYPVLNAVTKLDGFPVKMKLKASAAGKQHEEEWNIEKVAFADIDDSVFELPENYRKFEEEKADE